MKSLFFLYNPNAGNGKINSLLPAVLEKLNSFDVNVIVYPTRERLDGARVLAERGEQNDVIVVAGGDGMLHEAINGLLAGKVNRPLLYLPSGTVNDFAATHEIPRDVLQAIDLYDSGKLNPLDIGCFNGEYFGYIAAFGLGTTVSYKTGQQSKNRFGMLAYLTRSLSEIDFIHWENNSSIVRVTHDQGEFIDDIIFGAVSNTRFIAGMDLHPLQAGKLQDGCLEGLFVKRPMNVWELNQIIRDLLARNEQSPYIYYIESSHYSITSQSPLEWTLDGEYGGSVDHAEIEAVSEKFLVYTP